MSTVTATDLAEWARLLSDLLDRTRVQVEKSSPKMALWKFVEESSIGLTNSTLNEAVLDVASGIQQGGSIMTLLLSRSDVFDRWFVYVLGYGFLYDELEIVLRRFADRPEEMAFDYFGETGGRCTAPSKSRDPQE